MAGKLCFFRLKHGSVARLGVCQFNYFSMLGNLSIANTGHGDIYYKNAKKHMREVHINTIRCVAVPKAKLEKDRFQGASKWTAFSRILTPGHIHDCQIND